MLLAAVVLHLSQGPVALLVRVVEGARDEVVEGAEVRWIPFGTHGLDKYGTEPLPYSMLIREDLFAVAPDATTGADGTVRLAPTGRPGALCVSKAGRRGCVPWSPNMLPDVRVRLFRDWPLDVEVVDPSGADLEGLGVCVRYATEGETGYRDMPVTRVPIRSGRAHIQHAGYLQSSTSSGGACYAGLTGWIGDPVQTWIPREEAPFDRVVLRLPPHGSLVLKIVDEDGRPSHAMDPACLGLVGRLPHAVAWPQDPSDGTLSGGPGFVAHSIDGDRVVFRHVSLGAKLEASVSRNLGSATTVHACSGPRTPAEIAESVLQLGEGLVTLRGSVLVPEGLSIISGSLGEAGPFTIDLDEAHVRLLDSELAFLAAGRDSQSGAGFFQWWPEGWKKGLNEVGVLRLEDPPCVLTGTVLLAATHAAAAGVEVELPDPFIERLSAKTTTAQDGTFLLRACPQSKECKVEFRWLAADGERHQATRKVRRGTRDLRVELE